VTKLGEPLFITVEGGEGVGKSHFVSGLAKALEQQGCKLTQTREPGGTTIADRIREVFVAPPASESITPMSELCLVSAARCQHVNCLIKPSLQQGRSVLCDRFIDSTRVYQGSLGGVGSDMIETIIKATTSCLEPDITFVLDCPVEVSLKRLSLRSSTSTQASTRYDQAVVGVHERIRSAFLELALRFKYRIRVIDARQSPEQMVSEAVGYIKEWHHAKPQ